MPFGTPDRMWSVETNMIPNSHLLSLAETAQYLNTTPRHVRSLRDAHGLPAVKLGGKLRFRRSDLDSYIEANLEPHVTPGWKP